MIKKHRLIFVFHILDNIDSFDNDYIYKLHFKCLEYYSYVFDEATFIITANDFDNKLIWDAQYRISNIFNPFCKLKFIIEKNDKEYREGIHFYNYVLKRLDKYDGLTMFGHTKGVFNYDVQDIDVSDWVLALYHFNLSYMYDVDNKLIYDKCYYLYAGVYSSRKSCHMIPYWYANGSFYWMNCKKIAKYIKDNNIDIDDIIYKDNYRSIRYVAELFFPKLFDETKISFFDMSILKNNWMSKKYGYIKFDVYSHFDEYLRETLNYFDYTNYIKFKNEITTDL